MTRLPAFEFARLVFFSGVAQFRDDFGILRGEPVLKFVKRFHRRKHRHGNFNGIRCHAINLPAISGMASGKLISAHAADHALTLLRIHRGTLYKARAACKWFAFGQLG
jgi:hypothetical protein